MIHTSTYLPEDLIKRLDAMTVAMAAQLRLPGFTKAHAHRACLERGLDALDRELAPRLEGNDK